jgi:hypothetical protein
LQQETFVLKELLRRSLAYPLFAGELESIASAQNAKLTIT